MKLNNKFCFTCGESNLHGNGASCQNILSAIVIFWLFSREERGGGGYYCFVEESKRYKIVSVQKQAQVLSKL